MAHLSQLLCFVVLLSLGSCISFEKIPIEVYKPSEFTIPKHVNSIGIVARNLKFPSDTLQNFHLNKGRLVRDKVRFNTDSLAQKICLDSLASKLMQQGRFDRVFCLPVDYLPTKKIDKIRPEISYWYRDLASTTKADALILLDMFSCFYTINDDSNYPEATVITSNAWSVYDAKRRKLSDRYPQIDTLYWSGVDDDGNFKKIDLPGKKEAISLAAGVIGVNYARHIVPDWTLVYRELMTTENQELKSAVTLAKKGNWNEATVIWQKYADRHNQKNRVISLYNLALASEMDGDTDKALELTTEAAKASSSIFMTTENQAIKKYAAILFKRKIEIEKLNKQNEVH